MLTPPPRTDRRGAPQESLSVLTRRPEAAVLPHLGMPFADACVLRLSGSSRTQCGGRAAQGAGDRACTVVCCIGHQSWNKWPKAPEMRGGDGKGCLEGSAAMAARTPAPSPPPPLPGWPWFLSQGACRRQSLAAGHRSMPRDLLASGFAVVSLARLGSTEVCTRPEVSRQILTSLYVEPEASGGGQ